MGLILFEVDDLRDPLFRFLKNFLKYLELQPIRPLEVEMRPGQLAWLKDTLVQILWEERPDTYIMYVGPGIHYRTRELWPDYVEYSNYWRIVHKDNLRPIDSDIAEELYKF